MAHRPHSVVQGGGVLFLGVDTLEPLDTAMNALIIGSLVDIDGGFRGRSLLARNADTGRMNDLTHAHLLVSIAGCRSSAAGLQVGMAEGEATAFGFPRIMLIC